MSEKDNIEFEVSLLNQLFKLRKVSEFDPLELEICHPKIVKEWSYKKMKSVLVSLHRDDFGKVTKRQLEDANN